MKSFYFLPTVWALSTISHAATTLESIVVTPTRTALSTDEALANVTVIDSKQLANLPLQDIGDILRTYADVDVVRSGGLGQNTSIFIRGSKSEHVLVLVDGVRINSSTFGGINIQNFLSDNIERIEVVKGARSSQYGSNAIGGVIQIFTKKKAENRTQLQMNIGSNNTVAGEIQNFSSKDNFSSFVHLGGLYTDGYPIFSDSPDNRGYKNQFSGGRLNYRSDNWDVSASVEQKSGRVEYLDFFSTTRLMNQTFDNRLSTLQAHYHWNDNQHTEFTLGQFDDNQQQSASSDYIQARRQEVTLKHDVQLKQHLLTAGLYGNQEKISSLSYGTAYDKTLNNTAFFLQDQIKWQDFSLLLAGRAEQLDQYGNHETGELSLGYHFNAMYRVFASVSQGFRAPSGNDLYGYGGNTNLRPERSLNQEIGLQVRGNKWNAAASIFQNRYTDLIDIICDISYTRCVGTNIDKANSRGIELSLNLEQETWAWRNQLHYLHTEDEGRQVELARRPARSVNSQLVLKHNLWQYGAEVQAKSHSKNSNYDDIQIPGFFVMNLFSTWQINSAFKLTARINNLSDTQYGLAADGTNGLYLAPGRNYQLGALFSY